LVGYVEPSRVPTYLAAADVLVLPNSGVTDISRYYTSPLKLFEYMATGRPIVASDLPAMQEVLVEGETALLVPSDDPAALAAAICRLRSRPALAQRLAQQAKRAVGAYAWDQRATRLLNFLDALLKTDRASGESALEV
ncbi:MAG: glycosyltransferase, partial [Methyloligellaceae bacterium]